VMQASRNGYFFVLDRTTGKNLLTAPFAAVNWANGIDKDGRPTPNPAKEPTRDGVLRVGAPLASDLSVHDRTALGTVRHRRVGAPVIHVFADDRTPRGHSGTPVTSNTPANRRCVGKTT